MKKLQTMVLVGSIGSAVLLLSGCDKAKQMMQNQVQNTAQQKVTEAMFSSVKDPDVRKYMVAQANQRSFRTKTTIANDHTTMMEVAINGDSYNYKTTEMSGGKEVSSMIVIGDTTYVKDYADGKWWKQTAKPTPDNSSTPEPKSSEKPTNFQDKFTKMTQLEFKFLGKEPCPNDPSLTCFKYQDVDANGKTSGHTFWFDDKQYLLRRDEYNFGAGAFGKTATDYSYDNVSVQAPSPTKDVPAGKDIMEMTMPSVDANGAGGGMPSAAQMKQVQDFAKQFGGGQSGQGASQQQAPAAPQDQAFPAATPDGGGD